MSKAIRLAPGAENATAFFKLSMVRGLNTPAITAISTFAMILRLGNITPRRAALEQSRAGLDTMR
jgi:hypothetical protein